MELATARQTFFSNLINSNLNNTLTLFATVERLTNPPNQIPNEMLSDSKCNEFACSFSEKISNIRKEIGTSSYAEVTQIQPQFQKEVTMSVFEAIDSNILEEIVQHLKSSTCYLDSPPTSFFKSVLNCLEQGSTVRPFQLHLRLKATGCDYEKIFRSTGATDPISICVFALREL